MTPITASLGQLLDVTAAAAYLGMTEKQLRREIQGRRIRLLRRGRAISFYTRWLDEYVERQSVPPTGDARGVAPDMQQMTAAPLSLRDMTPRVRQIRVRSRRQT